MKLKKIFYLLLSLSIFIILSFTNPATASACDCKYNGSYDEILVCLLACQPSEATPTNPPPLCDNYCYENRCIGDAYYNECGHTCQGTFQCNPPTPTPDTRTCQQKCDNEALCIIQNCTGPQSGPTPTTVVSNPQPTQPSAGGPTSGAVGSPTPIILEGADCTIVNGYWATGPSGRTCGFAGQPVNNAGGVTPVVNPTTTSGNGGQPPSGGGNPPTNNTNQTACSVTFSDVPATINSGQNFTATITRGPTTDAASDWQYVSLYMDSTRVPGGTTTSNGYTWTVPAGSAGTHTLKFRVHDYGYYNTSGSNANIGCTPTASFTTAGASQPTSADVNKNGCTDINDFNEWLLAYQHNGTPSNPSFNADLNGDGQVDLLDYNIWYKVMTAGTNACH